jgi:hypothetical protein
MNVFEDLIEELREENLLEETVIELRKAASQPGLGSALDTDGSEEELSGARQTQSEDAADPEAGASDEPVDERDFYRKRAMAEVSSLQMVEHVISGIEREYMKVVPKAYDDLEAKKALHRFVQVTGDTASKEYAEAEFHLMRETEAWSTALSERDQKISVANLRRFCENSRPVLSSQALMALGRFYRNAAYSNLTRAKFDLVMTRLFSREMGDEKRKLLFNRVDMIGHIRTLYANWASVALYSAEEASLQTRAVVAGFDDRVKEAESADSFEKLLENSFFDTVHEFKEATGEMFFTPEVVAAAIDCNIRIGNRFVELIRLETEKTDLQSIERKYGYEYDQVISDAAGKTLQLVELLKGLPADGESDQTTSSVPVVEKRTASVKKETSKSGRAELFRVNKWLLAATILVVLASIGMFFWANQPDSGQSATEQAASVEISAPELTEYLRSGRATPGTFYAITLPAWSELPEARKKEVLQKAREFANSKGLATVRLINVRGDLEAYATASRSEVLNPAP